MKTIERNNVSNVEEQFSEGISYWLRGKILDGYKKPSWSVLVETLEDMGERAVAEGIKKEKI